MAATVPPKGAPGPKKTVAKKATPRKRAPGKAVAKVKDTRPQAKSDFTPAKAKSHTQQIAVTGGKLSTLLLAAYKGRIWFAMGKDYTTWQQYLEGEFGGAPFQLPRTEAKVEALKLAEGGMSTQAIADALGRSKAQVAKDVAAGRQAEGQVSQNETPAGDKPVIDIDPKDVSELPDAPNGGEPEPGERVVLGKDGKEYHAPPPPAPKQPTVVNIVSAARTLAKDLDSVRIRLDSLVSRDDYEENKVDVQGTLETVVGDLIDTLVEEFGDMVAERMPEPQPAA